ncbi:MAG TPA: hypothetical protein PKC43_11410 [Phycisphaerales bacterium]|nr:hypothetical protein [Phycisphaerales bacterium]HMP38039.1 hypothetical protein [Phycisphaerales bacterium]
MRLLWTVIGVLLAAGLWSVLKLGSSGGAPAHRGWPDGGAELPGIRGPEAPDAAAAPGAAAAHRAPIDADAFLSAAVHQAPARAAPASGPTREEPRNRRAESPSAGSSAVAPEPVPSAVARDAVGETVESAPDGGAASEAAPVSAPAPALLAPVRGRGSELDPFRPTWELLRSAERTFDAAAGLESVPRSIVGLGDHLVRITGYFAAATSEERTREILLMYNRWDGCCLGLPPSPFDSIEVRLREPIALRGQHMIRYGTITGRFEIEPFVVADWVIGLYRIVDASLEWGG